MSPVMSEDTAEETRLPLPSWLRRLIALIHARISHSEVSGIRYRDIQMDALSSGVTHETYWKYLDELETDNPEEETAHLMSTLTLTRDSLDVARGQKATKDFQNRTKLQLEVPGIAKEL